MQNNPPDWLSQKHHIHRCLVEVLRLPAAGLNKSDPRAANVCTIAQELMVLLNKAISCAPFMLESSDVKFTMEVTDRVMDSYVQVHLQT